MNGTARLSLVPPRGAPAPVRPAPLRPGPPRRAALPVAAAAAEPIGLRLTRRGRLAALVVFLAVLLTGGVLFGYDTSRASGEAAPPREYTYVVVQPGQTLWGIARTAAPGVDPRATIERIRDLNALADTGVQAGQRIALP